MRVSSYSFAVAVVEIRKSSHAGIASENAANASAASTTAASELCARPALNW